MIDFILGLVFSTTIVLCYYLGYMRKIKKTGINRKEYEEILRQYDEIISRLRDLTVKQAYSTESATKYMNSGSGFSSTYIPMSTAPTSEFRTY